MDARKNDMIAALRQSRGIVSIACEAVGISRQTHYNWIKDDPEYVQAVDDANEAAIDHVESKLLEKIDGITVMKGFDDEGKPVVYEVPPSDTAIIFYLKCKGKKRGYIERTELAGVPEAPLQIVIGDKI